MKEKKSIECSDCKAKFIQKGHSHHFNEGNAPNLAAKKSLIQSIAEPSLEISIDGCRIDH